MLRWEKAETHSEPSQTSKMEPFAEIINGWKPFTIFGKRSFSDVWMGFEYVSVF